MLSTPSVSNKTHSYPPASLPTPVCHIDDKGNILNISHAARRVLEYGSNDDVGPNFFSLVNRRNLAQVLRDIEDISRRCKSKASWLLRLWTGKGRWRWYKATVQQFTDMALPDFPADGKSHKGLIIHLQDVHDW